ncbi:hypothetical protein B0J14DRAFT_619193 [Halenospora varia]|nr:hypothetical protein B0J14DRAFT_619193 [Halenospora varia]
MSSNENTSAQRKRKDPHTEDLGDQFSVLENNPANFVEENKRLKLELQKVATENEILRATSTPSYPLPSDTSDFYTEMLSGHGNKEPSHRIVLGESGDRWLAAGSTWDYIIKHPLYTKGLVDLGNVTERLKKVAKTDGQGVVWEEREIINAIEKSVASGNDEFI